MAVDILQKARNYCFLLLKYRMRSERELWNRLKKKKFDDKVIRETLEFLKEKDFINDQEFSRAWIQSRLKRPFGLRRIKEELRLKGVDQEIIDSQLNSAKQDYSEDEVVLQIVQQRLKRLGGLEPDKAKQRVYGYLLRRGFSPESIIRAIN